MRREVSRANAEPMETTRCVVSWISVTAGLALVAACQQQGEAPSEGEKKAEPIDKAPEAEPSTEKAVEPPAPWERVEIESLSQTQQKHLGSAKAAKKALGQGLMKELSAALKGGDFAKGVEACKGAAPKVADQVSSEHGVDVGRTSFKVRNPDNTPRDWAEPFVEGKVNEEIVLVNDGGGMAYMSPIGTKEVCLNCHGSASDIPSEVAQILSEEYPEDQATGFDVGDLRGWFWVEYHEAEG